MKTSISILDRIAIILFFVLLTMASLCFGGVPDKVLGAASVEQPKDSCILISFTAKGINNKVYTNWCVVSTFSNYYFVLERSFNGRDYSVINVKKGFKSPASQALQFSYMDAGAGNADSVYYRIKLQKISGADQDAHLFTLSNEDMFSADPNASISLVMPQSGQTETAINYSSK